MPEFVSGSVVGNRFEVAGVLGRGGMATVYLAFDRLRGEQVALKVLHEHLSQTTSMRERLRREVLAASRLRHPHALVALDLHELDGALALSLPFHPGHTLADEVTTKGPLGAQALARLAGQLTSALGEAHRAGIVHRDVTPQNVMIDAAGNAALTDFGLARLEELRGATVTGVVGTMGFAAPETYQGDRADPRGDLYSLGAVLYFAATGHAPFEASNPMGIIQKQLEERFAPLSEVRPDLSQGLRELIERMLAREPSRRPQGAREVLSGLKDEAAFAEEEGAFQALRGLARGARAAASEPAASQAASSAVAAPVSDQASAPAEAPAIPLKKRSSRSRQSASKKEKAAEVEAPASLPEAAVEEKREMPVGPAVEAVVDRMLREVDQAVDSTSRALATTIERAIQAGTERQKPVPVASSPLPPGEEVVLERAPLLPAGPFTVVVKERSYDRERRRKLRRQPQKLNGRRRRRKQNEPAKTLESITETVRQLFVNPDELAPEESVAGAVAKEAGLPGNALVVSHVMLERAFRLAHEVDAQSANRLAVAAQQAGFSAEVISAVPVAPPTPPVGRGGEVMRWIFLILFFMAVTTAFTLPPPLTMVLVVYLVVRFLRLFRRQPLPVSSPLLNLPLAYQSDLSPWLADGYRLALQAPSIHDVLEARGLAPVRVASEPEATTGGGLPAQSPLPAPVVRPQIPLPSPSRGNIAPVQAPVAPTLSAQAPEATSPAAAPASASPAGEGRLTQLLSTTNTQLDALERAVQAREADLPEIMGQDLRLTLKGLRQQVEVLGKEAARVQRALAERDEAAMSAAVARVEARLTRLQTLQRGGQPVDAVELRELERALATHGTAQAEVEALEGQATLIMAQLLEIGSAATQAVRELRREVALEVSAPKLLERLREEARAAAGALQEVERSPLPQRSLWQEGTPVRENPVASAGSVPLFAGESTTATPEEKALEAARRAEALRQG